MPPITEILFGDQDGRRVISGQTVAQGSVGASAAVTLIAQITAAEIAAGKRATEIAFGAVIPSSGYVLTIAADTQDYNVYDEFVAAYGVPPDDVELEVIVNSGVVVSASDNANVALTWGNSWTGTPDFTLTNNGYLLGYGGDGASPNGAGANGQTSVVGQPGQAGGNAVDLSGQTVAIDNGSGFIWGGGGGGGGGPSLIASSGGFETAAGGGGGGGGAGIPPSENWTSDAGVNWQFQGNWTENALPQSGVDDGAALILQTGGAGGAGGNLNRLATFVIGGTGGDGGDYGEAGEAGQNDGTGNPWVAGGAGGAAGKAIHLDGGTANFTSGSGSPNVKGAVS